MLIELNIKNFAIIQDLKIEFTNGLNLLTGETGAGKSIIIEAIGLILGGRSSRDLIKTGQEKATLQGLFHIENSSKIKPILKDNGIDLEPGNLLIITREVNLNSPSISRVNGKVVTLNTLNKITENLVDIFGQHEHQSLLNISNHQKLVDSFGDEEFRKIKMEIRDYYNKLSLEEKKLQSLNTQNSDRDRQMDLIKYQIEEIETANLTVEEELTIEEDFFKLNNMQSIKLGVEEILDNFQGQNYNGILDMINRNHMTLVNIKDYDAKLQSIDNRLESVKYELEDLNMELMRYSGSLEMDHERLNYLKDRMDTINRLKRKYGNTIDRIIEYKNKMVEELNILINYEKTVEETKRRIEDYKNKLNIISGDLSERRKKIAKKLENQITNELKTLNMEDIRFKIKFEKTNDFTSEGFDRIEFLISTNIGEDLKPLSRIVSGGEMSRIMLGFKSILADYDNIPTLIFDEIDTGISGRTAQIVGEKISKIASNRQVISISHLPQIAALADSHFIIYKDIDGGKTISNISRLSEAERVEELARLLGGVDLTDTTIKHAKEMLDMSKKIKKRI